MPLIPDVVNGQTIDPTTYGNTVLRRIVNDYASTALRDAARPAPFRGETCTVNGDLQTYNGTRWVTVGTGAGKGWTPTLTAIPGSGPGGTSSDPSLGSGSNVQGRYAEVGGVITAWCVIGFGTSALSSGAGIYQVSLPAPPVLPFGFMPIGFGYAYDASQAVARSLVARQYGTNGTTAVLTVGQRASANDLGHSWNGNADGPWEATDAIYLALSYPVV